jgi:hypothetical protein
MGSQKLILEQTATPCIHLACYADQHVQFEIDPQEVAY